MSKYRKLLMPDGRVALLVARQHGVSFHAFLSRVRNGWTIENAATKPMNTDNNSRRGGTI